MNGMVDMRRDYDVLVSRSRLERAASVLERDGDEHGVARELRDMLSPRPGKDGPDSHGCDHGETCGFCRASAGLGGGAAATAAIAFALQAEEGMAFLRLWNEGEFDATRREWPEAPAAVYTGADPALRPAAQGLPLPYPGGR